MDFQNDPELEKLFKDELDERSAALIEGARAMASGDLTPELAGRMLREGHTIKGTGRVMGYEAIARGGEASEFVWRWIQQGDLEPSSMLGRTLEHLAEAIPDALGGGTKEISASLETVRELIDSPELLEKLPEPLDMVDEVADEPAEPEAEPESPEDAATEDQDQSDEDDDEDEDDDPAEVLEGPVEVEIVEAVDEAGSVEDTGETEQDEQELADTHGESVDEAPLEPVTVEVFDHTGESLEERLARMEAEEAAAADVEQAAEVTASDAPATEAEAAPPVHEDLPEAAAVDDEPEEGGEAPHGLDLSFDSAQPPADSAASDAPQVPGEAPEAATPSSPEPLVWEPDANGKLPTPTITYEIVSSAFVDSPADTARPAVVAPIAPDGAPTLSLVEETVLNPANEAVYNLGGLVGAVETWANEESVPVNAGRLFRMINDTAALRIDLVSAIAQTTQLLMSVDGVSSAAREGTLESLEIVRRATLSLQDAALGLTSIPLDTVLSTLPQLVKYLSKKVSRDVQLSITGSETVVDRQLVDRIGEIIRQLVVNAVAHGVETPDVREAAGKASLGHVEVTISSDSKHVTIEVADDGAGVDWKAVRELAIGKGMVSEDPTHDELRSALYSNGFSTNPESSEFTGVGDGLARVRSIVEETYGSMTLDSVHGAGTRLVVTLPVHRALQQARIFRAGGTSWGVPVTSVIDVVNLSDLTINVTGKGSFVGYKDESVPYSSFSTAVGLDVEGMPAQVLILQSPTGSIALAVDDVMDQAEVATKDLGPLLSDSDSVVCGVALLGGDETVMLVDAGRLAEKMRDLDARPEGPVHTVLVVDDSQGVRQVVSGVLASHGFSTLTAGSVSDALAVLSKQTVDALVVDFSMPRADGVALIHMVRQRYGHIPVVMLSGVANEDDRARAERAGADAFFDKADFAKGALVDKLRELVSAGAPDGSATIAS